MVRCRARLLNQDCSLAVCGLKAFKELDVLGRMQVRAGADVLRCPGKVITLDRSGCC